jgi:hypothetical protein
MVDLFALSLAVSSCIYHVQPKDSSSAARKVDLFALDRLVQLACHAFDLYKDLAGSADTLRG